MITLFLPEDREGELYAILVKDEATQYVRMARDGERYDLEIKLIDPETGEASFGKIGSIEAWIIDLWLEGQPS